MWTFHAPPPAATPHSHPDPNWKGSLISILLSVAILISTGGALGDVADWEESEVIAVGVTEIPSSAGSAAAHVTSDDDEWHVVYEMDGDIYHRTRADSGWLAPEQLTDDPGESRDPKLAFQGSVLHVVWEDDRTGHPEVWTRRWDGTEWSGEECLTCDEMPSLAPVIAVRSNEEALLVWQEGDGEGSQIHGSFWPPGAESWEPPLPLSEGSESAFEPSVAGLYTFGVVWADTRNGDPEIYIRRPSRTGDHGPEVRVTYMQGSCRRPDLGSAACCGNDISQYTNICFENDQTGVAEVYSACYADGSPYAPVLLSEDDGIPSTRPGINGYRYYFYDLGGDYGGTSDRYFVTWTDETGPGAAGSFTHRVAGMGYRCGDIDEQEVLSEAGMATSSLGGIGYRGDDAYARVVTLWIEDYEGQPALYSRRGKAAGCVEMIISSTGKILVAPEGAPADSIYGWNDCGAGSPLPLEIRLDFSQADDDLTWDATQEHPFVGPIPFNDDGYAIFPVRAGGCSETGDVVATIFGVTVAYWPGVKSPDVDGDCIVTFEDMLYVTSKLGTDDFCADLDGSDLVDLADVAIVEATMGDHCTQVTAADDRESAGAGGLRARVFPNPLIRQATINFDIPEPGDIDVRIVDARGRLVRSLSCAGMPEPRGSILWDGRDGAGRRVASGAYFVRVRAGSRRAEQTVLVLR